MEGFLPMGVLLGLVLCTHGAYMRFDRVTRCGKGFAKHLLDMGMDWVLGC